MTNQQKGFTLVELAIVITIIGLLIGGILKGQQLITNARVTATINQINAYTAAAMIFYDSYGALPGDMNGTNKIPGCTGTLCAVTTAGELDGKIGSTTTAGVWDLKTPKVAAGNDANGDGEPLLFWYYLSATGMINGVDTKVPVNGAGNVAWGKTNPAAKIGGGFLAGYSDGQRAGLRTTSTNVVTIVGNVFALAQSVSAADTASSAALLPTVAAQIDRKVDDGNPVAGTVQATGAGTSAAAYCTTLGTFVNTDTSYKEDGTQKVCDLIIKFGG